MTTFSLNWTVAGVDHTKDFSSRRNIKKPVLFPRYQGSVGGIEAVLAYVGSSEVDPSSNLTVIHQEDSLIENSRTPFSKETTWVGTSGVTSASSFLLTDIFGQYVSSEPEPFYWKHVLPSADIDPDSIAILDINLQEVDKNSYSALRVNARDSSDLIVSDSYESCSVFSNYVNSFNIETEELTLYFVRYSSSGTSHYQILNSEPVFSEAGIDDISSVTGNLKSWRKVYTVATGASFFTVTTPGVSTAYSLKPREKSRILVREPTDTSDSSPWFMNISNGSFSTVVDGRTYTYSIPEFSAQTFSPIQPYKIEVEELARYLRDDLIKVTHSPMKIDSSFYKMEIRIKNAQQEVLYALTTNSASDGTYYEEQGERVFRTIETDNAWVTWDSNGIAGWDAEEGLLHLQREYPDTYYFYVTYYYEESGFEYTSLNVNPIFDEGYDGQFYALYVVPEGGYNSTGLSSAVEYLKIDRSGRVVEASQDGTGGSLDIASTINVGEQYMYYSLNAETTGSGLNYEDQSYVETMDGTGFPSSGILVWQDTSGDTEYQAYNNVDGNRIYFESYTLTETLPASTTFRVHSFLTPYSTANSSNLFQWFILSEIHASSSSRVDELSVIDLRKPGGVIKDKYKKEAMAIDARAIWARPEIVASRGQTIPGDSVAVFKVPYTLLKEYGGRFTRDEVEAIVSERHLATGVLPVVLFDGAIPKIDSISSTTTTITICWDSEGTDYSYNIYYSAMKEGPWSLANSSPFADQIYGNCYTISNLISGLIYYIRLSAVDSNEIEGPQGDIWGIKTRTS